MHGRWSFRPFARVVILIAGFWLAPPADAGERRYDAAVQQLDSLIAREVADKQLPALSIALVDDQTIVWSKGYGYADPETKKRATPDTIYRVGSISKLFTALAAMQLVERDELDLDASLSKYLPDFQPADPFGKPVTLRHLLSHRAGLARETPVGSYFDPASPSLADTVASLNKARIIYEPGRRLKYSNAAFAALGRLLEVKEKAAFAEAITRKLIQPLGLRNTSFDADNVAGADVAKGLMWTEHGREFPAPTFPLGISPACGLRSNATDLARFLSALFAAGKTSSGQVLRPETLSSMWKLQFARADAKRGYGLAFMIGELDGHRLVGHDGAVYGFASELAALPDDKLGVVVLTSRDCANGVTEHVANEALKLMLAAKNEKALPAVESTSPLKPGLARQLSGGWKSATRTFDLEELGGRLWRVPGRGGARAELRSYKDGLLTDDSLSHGLAIELSGDHLKVGVDSYDRMPEEKPKEASSKWRGLIGEYGWDHQTLYILERNGKLHALVEWFFMYPLAQEAPDIFRFPDLGLFAGEKVQFSRDETGRATRVVAGGVTFERRKVDGENGETFRIKAQRPLADLRREAASAMPPAEKGDYRKPDLVELTALEPGIKLDIRYASDNNFLSTPFYTSARAFMQRPAAEAVARVHRKLAEQGYGLLVFDGYRPWSVTKMFWEATPEKQRIFVADPSKGSRHNRGCAVDLTLYDLKTGKPIEMVGGYDEFSDRSYPQYPGGTTLQRWHRLLLRHAMEAEGFTVYEAEWWHFDFKDWQRYPILNKPFEELAKTKP
jgi:CubicO group peptidase (beta-lactamase class C family)/D-alanyl-D-alanine dipeptidase